MPRSRAPRRLSNVNQKESSQVFDSPWCYANGFNTSTLDFWVGEMATDRIEINPTVMMGKPVIRGTRIPVELILRKLAEGATEEDLLDAYPRLERADLRAAIAYAADTLAHEEILTLESSGEP
jgi:uncharacterized protein (DUF433 family)